MRVFIAVELPRPFEEEVASLARQLRGVIEARYLPRQNYHITVAFLGEIAGSDVDDVIAVVEKAASLESPIPLRADGIGKFGRPQNATLWMGLRKDADLMDLAERIREGLKERGIPFDAKPFRPHITLARHAVITKSELPPLWFPQDGIAPYVTVFKSTLSKDGAVYDPLHTVKLPEVGF